MYCSSCGGAVARALTYCNHCGEKLAGSYDIEDHRTAPNVHESLVWSQVGVLAVGLGGIIGLMAVMKKVVGFNLKWITLFTIVSFLLVIAVEGVLISQLLRANRRQDVQKPKELAHPTTKELEPPAPRMLPDPVPSVTEHTTRAFDPVYATRLEKKN